MEDQVVYIKEPCAEDDPVRFLLDLYPAPAWTTGPGLTARFRDRGFRNWDFNFAQYRGVRADGVCAVNVPLPGYAIARIRTGQFLMEDGTVRHLWREDIRASAGVATR